MEKDYKQFFLVVGMAGSGKTTFCHKLYDWLSSIKYDLDVTTGLNQHIFSINLDPAVINTKMPLNEDIRDTINYDDVMKNYNLGPNGTITTCLNLYLLKVDQLLNKIKDVEYVIIDTPGQIESFTWSSAGLVLIEALKSTKHKINILYCIDSQNCLHQSVFISNMLYAASLAARFTVDTYYIFNKADLICADNLKNNKKNILIDWINDSSIFRQSLDDNKMHSSLLSSISLYFEEFYSALKYCFVSSTADMGKEDFMRLLVKNINDRLEEIKL